MNRIFISYRSSDGKKDADRLCADLNRLFGDDMVFFDKQDLRGGTSWRSAIENTLGTQPVVLLLVTPELFGMAHPDGGRRIDREDDPIRNELLTAQHSGAIIVPLLTEGMQMPPASSVPEPLRFISEAHALKLRTDDWAGDLERILADLRAHNIRPKAVPGNAPLKQPVQALLQRVQRWLMYIGGGFVGLIVLGILLADEETAKPTQASTSSAGPTAVAQTTPETSAQHLASMPAAGKALDISGVWWSIDQASRRTRVMLTTQDGSVRLQTDPVPVAWHPAWLAYAQQLSLQGIQIQALRYSGAGSFADNRVQMPYEVFSTEGHGPLDSGNITLTASADGRELNGQIWSNGSQSASPLRMLRNP